MSLSSPPPSSGVWSCVLCPASSSTSTFARKSTWTAHLRRMHEMDDDEIRAIEKVTTASRTEYSAEADAAPMAIPPVEHATPRPAKMPKPRVEASPVDLASSPTRSPPLPPAGFVSAPSAPAVSETSATAHIVEPSQASPPPSAAAVAPPRLEGETIAAGAPPQPAPSEVSPVQPASSTATAAPMEIDSADVHASQHAEAQPDHDRRSASTSHAYEAEQPHTTTDGADETGDADMPRADSAPPSRSHSRSSTPPRFVVKIKRRMPGVVRRPARRAADSEDEGKEESEADDRDEEHPQDQADHEDDGDADMADRASTPAQLSLPPSPSPPTNQRPRRSIAHAFIERGHTRYSPPSPPPPSQSSSTSSSCHQCKMLRVGEVVGCRYYRTPGYVARGRPCKKNYCIHCLAKHYNIDARSIRRRQWICPSCEDRCSCSHCIAGRKSGVIKPHYPPPTGMKQMTRKSGAGATEAPTPGYPVGKSSTKSAAAPPLQPAHSMHASQSHAPLDSRPPALRAPMPHAPPPLPPHVPSTAPFAAGWLPPPTSFAPASPFPPGVAVVVKAGVEVARKVGSAERHVLMVRAAWPNTFAVSVHMPPMNAAEEAAARPPVAADASSSASEPDRFPPFSVQFPRPGVAFFLPPGASYRMNNLAMDEPYVDAETVMATSTGELESERKTGASSSDGAVLKERANSAPSVIVDIFVQPFAALDEQERMKVAYEQQMVQAQMQQLQQQPYPQAPSSQQGQPQHASSTRAPPPPPASRPRPSYSLAPDDDAHESASEADDGFPPDFTSDSSDGGASDDEDYRASAKQRAAARAAKGLKRRASHEAGDGGGPSKKVRLPQQYDPVPCPTCGKILRNVSSLRKHQKGMHGNTLTKCARCKVAFLTAREARYHPCPGAPGQRQEQDAPQEDAQMTPQETASTPLPIAQ